MLSYNILAQGLLEDNGKLYRMCPRVAKAWPWRVQNLVEEILHYAPSVACLQEVEEQHLPDLLGPLTAAGYEHRYKRRVGEGQTDGCATFWRTRDWRCVGGTDLEYGVADRGNIATIVVLAPTRAASASAANDNDPRRLVLANTHLLYNPKRGEIKLEQLQMLLSCLQGIIADLRANRWDWSSTKATPSASAGASGGTDAAEAGRAGEKLESGVVLRPSAVVCGDFNSTPDSAVYEWMRGGISDAQVRKCDPRLISGQVDPRNMKSWYETHMVMEGHQGSGTSSGVFSLSTSMGANANATATASNAGSAAGDPSVAAGSTDGSPWEDRVTADGMVYQYNVITKEVRQTPSTDRVAAADIETIEVGATAGIGIRNGSGSGSDSDGDVDGSDEGTRVKRARRGSATADEDIDVDVDIGSASTKAAAAKAAAADWVRENALGPVDLSSRSLMGPLYSCYAQPLANCPGAAGEPAFTTYHCAGRSTVDYIWHGGGLSTTAVLEMQTKHQLERYRGLPTKTWSSDHMSLIADLKWSDSNVEGKRTNT